MAKTHAKARATGPETGKPNEPVCPCCGYEIVKKNIFKQFIQERLPMHYRKNGPMELKFLGSGYPMFYNFIKYCIYLLLTLFLLKGAPEVASNFMGTFCTSTEQDSANWAKSNDKI